MAQIQARALDGIKVIEIAGTMTSYCGKLFADMGADVVLVEPPAGAPSRSELPLITGDESDLRSIPFNYHNIGKRSVTLDLDSAAGRQVFARMACQANLVLESEVPGSMARRGIDFASLQAHAPSLVVTSISPFGQTGPYAQHHAQDLTLLALGGLLSLAGFADSAPTRVWGNQAVLAAGQFAAVGSMAALFHAELHGEGQQVDISAQQCVVTGLENAVQFADLEGTVRKRAGGAVRYAGTGIFPCVGGEVFIMAAGVGAPRFWQQTVAWLRAEGVQGVEEIADDRWRNFGFLATEEAKAVFRRIFAPYAATQELNYLFHEGQRRGVPIVAVASPSDVIGNEQLISRNFFVPFRHSRAPANAMMPGFPVSLSLTPGRNTGMAPALGADTGSVLRDYGFSPSEIESLQTKEAA